ncbi:ribbon-helix-helix protein, CopG family [Cupriavidus metallidurans]|uniref:ribbon-helix-helix protein, CopG family n=1 Tax=Cupriavidus metallidurans TaxID=119219 RepID=UPI001CCA5F15|nr:ribbon-helix-helix protein, CopG family [Cupriavidus metallidurans]UBM09992.1 ribbon-helix-helix protein, CopG family [Cupriavidus metallidurans]
MTNPEKAQLLAEDTMLAKAFTARPRVENVTVSIESGRPDMSLPPAGESSDKAKTTRVQLELPDKAMGRLRALRDKTEAASYSEVVKNALRLYESMISQCEAGRRVFVKGQDGQLVEYEVFY